jgi:hypothetical protein
VEIKVYKEDLTTGKFQLIGNTLWVKQILIKHSLLKQ